MENYNKVKKDNWGTYYYLNDKKHRIDGPAIECANGEKYWHYKGKFIECNLQEEFERYVKLKLFW